MKTIFLITGQTRSYGKTFKDANGGHFRVYESQRWQLYRHFPDAHFVVSVQNDEDAKAFDLLKADFKNVYVDLHEQPAHVPEPEGAGTLLQAGTPYRISAPTQSIMKQLWAYKRGWDYLLTLHRDGEVECDLSDTTIIRLRSDLFFQRFDMPKAMPFAREAYTCRWGRYGGINDRFAMMGAYAAEAYFNALNGLQTLLKGPTWCPFHPESIQRAAIEAAGCSILPILQAEFTGVRKNGEMVQPVYMPYDGLDYVHHDFSR